VNGRTAIAAAALALLACERDPTLPEILGEPRCQELRVESPLIDGNLIIVLNDTMRRDSPGIYGGSAKTPHFDAFAGANLLFENAVTQAPWTKPSVATLFTSLYPSQHQLASHPPLQRVEDGEGGDGIVESDVLASSLDTLAEVLRMNGMRTAAFVSNPWMARPFGFDQGFEVYDESFARWGASGDEVIEAGLAWLQSLEEGERYFLYLHTIDSHRPYGPISSENLQRQRHRLNAGRRLKSLDGRKISNTIRLDDGRHAVEEGFAQTDALVRAAYLSAVEKFDAVLGRLLSALSLRGDDWDRTALVVTSDHGEALFTRGYGNHGLGLFDDETAVPLAARLPGVEPAQAGVHCLVGLVDLMPSLCSYLDIECPSTTQGWSFLPHKDEVVSDERRYIVTEGVMGNAQRRSIRNRRFKLVFEPPDPEAGKGNGYALYDLEIDPHEEFNRLEQSYQSPLTNAAFDAFRTSLPDAVEELPAPERSAAKLDAELRERLEAIGYIE
jgi:arylsulfatase A-like enzyme